MKSQQISIYKPLPKNLANAIACFTFPTKMETAKHFPEYIYINDGQVICWRVWNAEVLLKDKDEIKHYLAKYQ